ncbi:MAG: hypothetical protein HY744_18810 [Deltaproteobacteria bacterium]|nr:hypothetical protein [Deltaproteobacteria bacterium]
MAASPRVGTVAAAALCLLGGCLRPEPPCPRQGPPAPAPAPRSVASPEPSLPPYAVADGAGRGGLVSLAPARPGEDGGWLVDGLRVRSEESGRLVAAAMGAPRLEGGARVPASLGGGFLFWSRDAIYFAPAFLADLEPRHATLAPISAIAFAPSFALARESTGQRWAFVPRTGAAQPLRPPGLLDAAALPDGRALALLEGGVALASTDGGKRWADVTSRLASAPAGTAQREDAVWLATRAGPAYRLEPDGSLSQLDRLPDAPAAGPAADPRWREPHPPREQAVLAGVPLDGRTAAVVTRGTVMRIDLRSGAIVSASRSLLPDAAQCEGLRQGSDFLFACRLPGGKAAVLTGGAGAEPRLDRQLGPGGSFVLGDAGALAYEGRCTPSAEPPGADPVCIREADGDWREHGGWPSIAADAGQPRSVRRWIPLGDGDAAGVVADEQGAALLDARTGKLRALPAETAAEIGALFPASRSGRLVDRDWAAGPSGELCGWSDDASVCIRSDGTVVRAALPVAHLGRAGALAFGLDALGRAWQSTDRGRSWVEVEAPPGAGRPGIRPGACGEVGCSLGALLRLGWEARPPAPPAGPERSAPQVLRPGAVPQPELACQATGPAQISTAPELPAARQQDEDPSETLGLGARRLDRRPGRAGQLLQECYGEPRNPIHGGDASRLRALQHGSATELVENPAGEMVLSAAALGAPVDAWFVPPFDVAAPVERAGYRLRDWLRASRGTGGTTLDDALGAEAVPLPVLGSEPGAAAGLLLAGEALLLWLRPERRTAARLLPLDPSLAGWSVASAAAVGRDDLALLVVDGEGALRLAAHEGPGLRGLFELPPPPTSSHYPANPDAIAAGPDGELAVLRTPSGAEPPTADDPALLLRPGRPPQTLAPWSTLTAANAPECAASAGYRAVVAAPRGWLRVRQASALLEPGQPMHALVRWSAERVCLEALDVAAGEIELDGPGTVPLSVVARFAGVKAAARVGLVRGAELHQGLACELLAPAAGRPGLTMATGNP